MEHGDAASITPADRGPYLVRGPVRLQDADGNVWDTEGKAVIALCRCGGSQNKPFCDGTHNTNGFDAVDRAG